MIPLALADDRLFLVIAAGVLAVFALICLVGAFINRRDPEDRPPYR